LYFQQERVQKEESAGSDIGGMIFCRMPVTNPASLFLVVVLSILNPGHFDLLLL
jgi:hypothetical protein